MKLKGKTSPLVSVIMNCHNGEKYLRESIKSIISQTYNNWEIIFWDNCSNDKSKQILLSFNDKRIKYFYSKKILKLYHARNLAVKKSKGKYISFLDTDDTWDKNKLKIQINYLKKSKKKIIYTNYYILNNIKKSKKLFSEKKLFEGHITQKLLNNYKIGILTILIEKEIFQKHSFNKKYQVIGDFDLFIRLSCNFYIQCVQRPLASYRIHTENFSEKNRDLHIEELKYWINKNNFSFKKKSINIYKQKIVLFKLIVKKYMAPIIFFFGI
jgi:glycosyltransferase involved in cell wall biosynthesis|tara:strand:+ start:1224 stop:2030 length:807 start_codon:yes stop_codon:yes gene_type:complete